jgi:hypothetical protein
METKQLEDLKVETKTVEIEQNWERIKVLD